MSINLPPPVIAAPRPIYSTLSSIATVSQPPSNPAAFIPLPPTPPPYLLNAQDASSNSDKTTEDQLTGSFSAASDGSSNSTEALAEAAAMPPVSGMAALSKIFRDSLPARAKSKQFEFKYDDRDHFEAEVNEFYNYQDKLFIQEGRELFESSFEGEWKSGSMDQKASYIFCLLEGLECSNPEERYVAAKKLLYIAQGVFNEASTTEEQIELMKSNSRLLFDLDAFSFVHQALRVVSKTLDDLTKGAAGGAKKDPNDRQAAIDLANAETSVYLSLCYLLIEGNFGNPKLAEEISSTSGGLANSAKPIAVELFELIAQLAEGNRKHYPVKKLLLLLWKVLLSTIGAADMLAKQKNATRINEGLPELLKDTYLKSTPQDMHHQQITVSLKFPAYYPADSSSVTPKKIPLVDTISTHVKRNLAQIVPTLQPFETRDATYLPRSLREADSVIRENIYISHATLQMAQTKTYLDLWDSEPIGSSFTAPGNKPNSNTGEKSGFARPSIGGRDYGLGSKGLDRAKTLYGFLAPNMGTHIGMLVRLLYYVNLGNTSNGQGEGDGQGALGTDNLTYADLSPGVSMTREQRRDYLERIDVIRHKEVVTKAVSAIILILLKATKSDYVVKFEYISQLLVDNNCAILILKMLSLWFQNQNANANGDAGPNAGIGSWLIDRGDPPELNFFHFCRMATILDMFYHGAELPEADVSAASSNNSLEAGPSADLSSEKEPEDSATASMESFATKPLPSTIPACEVPMTPAVQKGSWRNFFTAINLLRILQKITKRKTHRILALVQWKASAVLKRVLKIQHIGLQLYALKLLKSQIPYLGRKWRGSNMKVVTAIYLHLRPYVKEEYLAGEVEIDVDDALAQEQSLRNVIAFYHHQIMPESFQFPVPPEGSTANPPPRAAAAMGSGESSRLARRQSEENSSRSESHSKASRSDHDELEAILNIVRRGTEAHSVVATGDYGGNHNVDPVTAAHAAHAAMPPLGRNHYRTRVVEDEAFGLDDNFTQNYEQWLQQEVFSPLSLWEGHGAASAIPATSGFAGDLVADGESESEEVERLLEGERGRTKRRSPSPGNNVTGELDTGAPTSPSKNSRPSSLHIPGKHHHRSANHHHSHHNHYLHLGAPDQITGAGDDPDSTRLQSNAHLESDKSFSLRSPNRELFSATRSIDRSTLPSADEDSYYEKAYGQEFYEGFVARSSPGTGGKLLVPSASSSTSLVDSADGSAKDREDHELDELHARRSALGWGVTMGPWLDGEDEFLDLWGMPIGAAGDADMSGAVPATVTGLKSSSPSSLSANATVPSISSPTASAPRSPYMPRHGSNSSLSPLRSVMADDSDSSEIMLLMGERRDRSSSRGRNRRQQRKESGGASSSMGSLVHSPLGSSGQISSSFSSSTGTFNATSGGLRGETAGVDMTSPVSPRGSSTPFSSVSTSKTISSPTALLLGSSPTHSDIMATLHLQRSISASSLSSGGKESGYSSDGRRSADGSNGEQVVPDEDEQEDEDFERAGQVTGSGTVAPASTPLSSAPASPLKRR
ncbi:Factor arrest protein 11 [Dinochytrium kinnereticum]|nr:Factor arrest protein 11 [Dinochytrium kinnereticum]